MTTWKKIRPGAGMPARTSFAVTRARAGSRLAALVVPASEPEAKAERVSIYSDGNGKLAFAFGRRGEYKVGSHGPTACARRVHIPAALSERIPYGTTDVSLTRDGDMLVLDLNAIPHTA